MPGLLVTCGLSGCCFWGHFMSLYTCPAGGSGGLSINEHARRGRYCRPQLGLDFPLTSVGYSVHQERLSGVTLCFSATCRWGRACGLQVQSSSVDRWLGSLHRTCAVKASLYLLPKGQLHLRPPSKTHRGKPNQTKWNRCVGPEDRQQNWGKGKPASYFPGSSMAHRKFCFSFLLKFCLCSFIFPTQCPISDFAFYLYCPTVSFSFLIPSFPCMNFNFSFVSFKLLFSYFFHFLWVFSLFFFFCPGLVSPYLEMKCFLCACYVGEVLTLVNSCMVSGCKLEGCGFSFQHFVTWNHLLKKGS